MRPTDGVRPTYSQGIEMAYSREVEMRKVIVDELMRKVIVDEWMSLDGVVQAPRHAQEDTDGGFAHGGWHMPYLDELSQDWVVEGYVDPGGLLLGQDVGDTRRLLAHRSGGGAGHRSAAEHAPQVRCVADAY
jgi:hypothetical protein